MRSSTFLKTALTAVALIGQARAQVTTSCDPTKGTCPNDKGLATPSYAIDFTSVNTLPSEWTLADSENVTLGPQGAEFAFEKRYDSPTMWTDFKFFFGRVEFVVKAAPGTGIVSSMVLLSGDLDEIDWEFLGGVTSTVQTNYFGKGYTGTYNRSTTPAVTSPQTTFHTYAIDWSPTALVWSIDGVAVRTLNAADADGNGSQYPQTPMKVSLSLWDAGDPDAATQGWGGGVTPIPPPEPYVMYVKSVKIWNSNPAQQYRYTDQSGSYKSIKLINEPIVSSSSSQISSQSTKTLTLGSTSALSSTVSASGSLPSGTLPSGALPSGATSTGNQSYVWNGPAQQITSSSDGQWSAPSSGCSTSEASSPTWASASGESDSDAQAITSTIDDTLTLPSTDCSCTLKDDTTTTTASPTVWVTSTNTGLWNTSSGTPSSASAFWWPTAAVSSAAASSAIPSPAYSSSGYSWQPSWDASTSVPASVSSSVAAKTLAIASSSLTWSSGTASVESVKPTSTSVYGGSVSWTTSWGTSTSVVTATPSCSETAVAAENKHVSLAISTPIAVSSIVSSSTPDATTWSVSSSTTGKILALTDSFSPYPSAPADTAVPASRWSPSLYPSWSSSSAQPVDTAVPASQWSSSSAQPGIQTEQARIVSSSASPSDNTWASADIGASDNAWASANTLPSANTWINSYPSATDSPTTTSSLTSTSTSTHTRILSVISTSPTSSPTDITISNTATQGLGYWNTSTIDSTPSTTSSYPTGNPSAPMLNPPLVSGSGGPWVNGTIPFVGAAAKDGFDVKIVLAAAVAVGSLFLFW
ncbi:MAG: hypothetical protein LQ350_006909 [Teloschistes chrysophthalmus]|nr:MAG: hypothetical protein LQ350_006909 [Niorma chrysophthalma]